MVASFRRLIRNLSKAKQAKTVEERLAALQRKRKQMEREALYIAEQSPKSTRARFYLPLKTVSEANSRDHWRAKAKRTQQHRFIAREQSAAHRRGKHARALSIVRLTRVSNGVLDDDNLRSALKATRDGIADWLGVDDGDNRVRYEYAQAKGLLGVWVEVFECPV